MSNRMLLEATKQFRHAEHPEASGIAVANGVASMGQPSPLCIFCALWQIAIFLFWENAISFPHKVSSV